MLIRFVTAPIDEDSQVESGIVVAAYRLRDDAHLSAYEHRPLVDCLRWVRRAPAAPGLPAAAETTIARGSRRRALADIQHCLGRVELLSTQHLVDAAYVQSGGRRGLKMAASLPFVCVQHRTGFSLAPMVAGLSTMRSVSVSSLWVCLAQASTEASAL
jgi:hypothetical protein